MFLIKVALIIALALPMSTTAEERCNIADAAAIETQLKGLWNAWMITTAVRFEIPDHLRNGPLTIEELAKRTNTNSGALFRLMRALKYYKVFNQEADGKWSNTGMSKFLTEDDTCSLKAVPKLIVHDEHTTWPNLYKVIQTGKPFLHGPRHLPYYHFLPTNKERYTSFRDSLGQILKTFSQNLTTLYDFTQYKHIVDISGNDGTLIAILMKASPGSTGAIIDMEYIRKDAMKNLGKQGLNSRVTFHGGDYFKEVPEGGDLYIMKQAFHDFEDEHALSILMNVAKQMRKKPAKMVIINQFLPLTQESTADHVWDIYDLMMVGGKDRTQPEYEQLFKKAGLRLNKVVPASEGLPTIMEIVLDS